MQVTLNGRVIDLVRPRLRMAVMFSSAIAELLGDDVTADENGMVDPDDIPTEYGTLQAAALGICLPPDVGAPRFKGSPRTGRLLDYGDAVDGWGLTSEDAGEGYAEACGIALDFIRAQMPTAERQAEAATPTEAHTEASSPA